MLNEKLIIAELVKVVKSFLEQVKLKLQEETK
jgi:hypothetical protein